MADDRRSLTKLCKIYNSLHPQLVVSYQPSAILCINPSDPQHPHVQAGGNKFCTICGATIALQNRYIPLRKLGAGGFAVIYTVWDLQTQTERVLKILLENSAKARELFQQEAAILQSLDHPGIPQVEADGYFRLFTDKSSVRELFCLVMEKIEGETLEVILDRYERGCPEEMVKDWFGQAVEILQVLHSRYIIHRDLKPSNLMLRQQTNRLVLIDFGGAKKMRSRQRSVIIDSSTRLYSPGYSPPEQSSGRDVEPAADFYALGRTTIELLTGQSPFELEDPTTKELRWRHLVQVSPAFAELLDELVREDARLRPTSAGAIRERLSHSSPPEKQPSVYQSIQQLSLNSWKRSQLIATYLTHRLAQITRNLAQTSKQRSPQLVNQIHRSVTQATSFLTQTARKQMPQLASQVNKTVSQVTRTLRQISRQRSPQLATTINSSLTKPTRSLLQFTTQVGQASIDTIQAVIWSAIAAAVGTAIGFVFAYFSPLGIAVGNFLAQYLPYLLADSQIATEAEIVIFATAGLFTAGGLTVLGVFDQRRRYLISALLGASGYVLGWLCWFSILPYTRIWGLSTAVSMAIAFLVSGLGLRRHHCFHTTVATVGTAIAFPTLVQLNLFPVLIFHLSPQPNWFDLQVYATFFSAIAAISSCWLGISHYIMTPCWQWLTRR
jgi:serine/threonine protein kinase